MEKIYPHLPASSAPYFLSSSLHVAPGLLYFFIFIMLISNAGLLCNISLCLTESSISFQLNNTYPFFRTQNSVMSELSLLIAFNTSNLSLLPLIHWIHIIRTYYVPETVLYIGIYLAVNEIDQISVHIVGRGNREKS